MLCSVCQKEMVAQDFGGVKVEVCLNGCKGMWFEWGQLSKLDQKNEGFGNALQEALAYSRYNDENRPQIKCPQCGILMHRHLFASEKEINVDECYKCGGFFLDSGELKIIRDKFMSNAEREVYEDKLLAQIPGYADGMSDPDKLQKRTEAIHQYSKYLTTNYYMSGK